MQCSAPRPSVASPKSVARDIADASKHSHEHSYTYLRNEIEKKGPVESSQLQHAVSIPLQDRVLQNEAVLQHSADERHAQNVHLREPGLSTSQSAPHNTSENHHPLDVNEIWSATAHTKPTPTQLTSPPATPPDTGLPYEVQHFILTTMQRILEEGCYSFASRWIPNVLYDKKWTCAEQVELKTWRDELPALLPLGAIKLQPDYSLTAALRDAVGIRNAATHRHLCDNFEIKKMARQAGGLMAMFDDPTRQSKYSRLWDAVHQWDEEHLELASKKEKLERALQEISERPVNDMDWSPNAASAQELTPSDQALPYDMGDLMDMD